MCYRSVSSAILLEPVRKSITNNSFLQTVCHVPSSSYNRTARRSSETISAAAMVELWNHLVPDDGSPPILLLPRVPVPRTKQSTYHQHRNGGGMDMERHSLYHNWSSQSTG